MNKWEYLLNVTRKDGTRETFENIPRGTCGCPILPRVGEIVSPEGRELYVVTEIHWLYQSFAVVIYAKAV
jgi:hypothetical protein